MYHGADRRKLADRRKGERRKFDPIAAQAYEEGMKRGELKERRKLEDRRKRARRKAEVMDRVAEDLPADESCA